MLQEGFAGEKQVQRIGIAIDGRRGRPPVAETFSVNMEVRARDFGLVRISMRRTVKIEPHKDNRLASPILVGGLGEFDPRAGHIEREVFPFVEGCQVKPYPLTGSRESPIAVINEAFFHCDERVSLGLRDFDISPALPRSASDSSAIRKGA
jgi:hypothetical protein